MASFFCIKHLLIQSIYTEAVYGATSNYYLSVRLCFHC